VAIALPACWAPSGSGDLQGSVSSCTADRPSAWSGLAAPALAAAAQQAEAAYPDAALDSPSHRPPPSAAQVLAAVAQQADVAEGVRAQAAAALAQLQAQG